MHVCGVVDPAAGGLQHTKTVRQSAQQARGPSTSCYVLAEGQQKSAAAVLLIHPPPVLVRVIAAHLCPFLHGKGRRNHHIAAQLRQGAFLELARLASAVSECHPEFVESFFCSKDDEVANIGGSLGGFPAMSVLAVACVIFAGLKIQLH